MKFVIFFIALIAFSSQTNFLRKTQDGGPTFPTCSIGTNSISIIYSSELVAEASYTATYKVDISVESSATLTYSCTVQDDKITLTCTHSSGETPGTYTLQSLSNGSENLDVTNAGQLNLYNGIVLNNQETQTITDVSTTSTVTIKIKSGLTSDNLVDFTFYYEQNADSQLTNCDIAEEGILSCTLPNGLTDSTYTIYVKNTNCESYFSTGKTVIVNTQSSGGDTQTPIEIDTFGVDDTCGIIGVSQIKITTKTAVSGESFQAVLADSNNAEYSFSVCTKQDSNIITCSQHSSTDNAITVEGVYTLKSLTDLGDSPETFTLDTQSLNSLTLYNDLIDKNQNENQAIVNEDTEITLNVVNSNIPSLFIGEAGDADIKSQCSIKDESNAPNVATCKLLTEQIVNLPFTLYYTDPCNLKRSTQIKLSQSTAEKTSIKVSEFKILDSSSTAVTCSSSAFTSIEVTTVDPAQGTISNIILKKEENTYTFSSCDIDSTNAQRITCLATSDTITVGDYSLQSIVVSEDSNVQYDLTDVTNMVVKYEEETTPIGDNTSQAQQTIDGTIESPITTFKILFTDDSLPIPSIYIGDKTKVAKCQRDTDNNAEVICSADDSIMQVDADNFVTIYYKAPCVSELQTTGVTVKKEGSTNTIITVSDMTFSQENTVTCSSSTTLYISTTGTIPGIITLTLTGTEAQSFICGNNGLNIISCELTGITPGTYTVTSLVTDDGSITIDTSALPASIEYDDAIQLASELGDKATQTITTENPKIYIPVVDKSKNAKIYISSADSAGEDPLTCRPVEGDSQMIECDTDNIPAGDTEYQIWYKPICAAKADTQIRVTKPDNSPITITVNNVVIGESGKSCSTTEISQISFSPSSAPTGELTVTLSNDAASSSCEYSNDLVRCDISITNKGIYTIKSITSTNSLETIVAPTTKIIYHGESDALAASQTNSQTINADTTTFTIILNGNTKEVPIIFLNSKSDNIVSCSRTGDEQTTLKCTPTTDNMPESEQDVDYSVWYSSGCDEMQQSTIVVTKKGTSSSGDSNVITASSISLSADSNTLTCQETEINAIYITVDNDDQGIITGELEDTTENHSTITLDSCTSSNRVITCNLNPALEANSYKLTSLSTTTDSTSFNIDQIKDTVISYQLKTSALESSQTNQEITGLQFTVALVLDGYPAVPSIYLDNSESALVSCKREDTALGELVCTATQEQMPTPSTDKQYTIYYKSSCSSELKPARLVITKKAEQSGGDTPKEITINTLSLNDGSLCTMATFSSIKLTLSDAPANAFTVAIGVDADNTFSFNCQADGTTSEITCTTTETSIPEGTYIIQSVTSGDDSVETFTVSTTDSIKYSVTLASNQNLTQLYDETHPSFTIELESGVSKPKIYSKIGEAYKEIACTLAEPTLTCEPTSTEMPTNTDYLIYYDDLCGNKQSTGITVTRSFPVTAQENEIISISLTDDATCTSSPFTSIKVELKEVPVASFTIVMQVADDETDTITFTCPSSSDKILTCSLPENSSLIPREYVIKSVTSSQVADETFIAYPSTTIKYASSPLSSLQSNLSQSITTSTGSFTLDMSADTLPKIYLDLEGVKTEITCTNHYPNLQCDYDSNKMENGKQYTVYTIDPCDESNYKSTDVVVSITISDSPSKTTFTVSSITLANGESCTTSDIASLSVTFSVGTPTKSYSVVLKDEANSESTFTCSGSSCSISTAISVSSVYTLVSITSSDESSEDFDTSSITVNVQKDTPVLATQQDTSQTIKQTEQFTVNLFSSGVTTGIYLDQDGSNQITCTPKGDDATILECPATNLAEGANTIYYDGPCGAGIITTGITVTINNSDVPPSQTTVTVENVAITDSEVCTYKGITSITITVDTTVTEAIQNAVLNDGTKDFTFSSCTPSEKTIVCTTPAQELTVGTYTLSSILSSAYTFSLSDDVKTISLQYNAKTLGAQTSQEMIGDSTFYVVLASESTVAPKIYVGNDSTKQVTDCDKDKTDAKKLVCTPGELMPTETSYNIYYEDPCGKINSAELTITKKPASSEENTITVTSISLDGTNTCSESVFTSFIFAFEGELKGAINYAVLKGSSASIKFTSCTPSTSTVTCTSANDTILADTYTLDEVNGDDTFSLDGLTDTVKFVLNPLGTQSKKQTVGGDVTTFYLILSASATTMPKVYVGNSKDNEISCTQSPTESTKLICTPSSNNFPTDGDYHIYYENYCEELLDTEIVVTKETPAGTKTITIESAKLDNGETCTSNPAFKFIFTASEEPFYLNFAEVLYSNTQTNLDCGVSGTTITCDLKVDPTEVSYTLNQIITKDSSKEVFVVSDEAKIPLKYQIEPLVEQTVKNYELTLSNPSFFVELSSDSTIVPTIYSDSEATNEIQCEPNGNQLKCTPTGLKGENIEIFYKGACDKVDTTSIFVTVIEPPTVKIISITVNDEADAATTNGITSIKMEVDQEVVGDVTEATIGDGVNSYKFTKCAANKVGDDEIGYTYNVICDTPETTIEKGVYKLKSVIGVDSLFDVSGVQESDIQYQEEKKPIKEPSDTEKEQTVSKNTPLTFTLASEDEKIPKIYLVNPENKEEKFSIEGCTKEGTTVSCPAYTETTPKGKFNVCFEGIFGDMVETGITVHVPVSVTSYTFGNDLGCAEGSFTDIKITFDSDVSTFGITEVKISALFPESEKPVEGSMPCVSNDEFNLQCYFENTEKDEPSKEENNDVGTYTLVGFTVTTEVNKIDVSSVEPIELKEAFNYLGEQIETNPIITNDTLSFTIVLASAETEAPRIFVGTDNDNEITCIKDTADSTQLICEPSDTNMPTNQLYDIYYENTCGELISTGIQVDYQNEQKTPEIEIQTGSTYIGMYKLLIAGLFVLIL